LQIFWQFQRLLYVNFTFIDIFMLDDVDRRILRHLQSDPAQPLPDLAALAGMTPARVTRRLDRMRQDGVLLGQRAIIDWRVLGYAIEVSLRVTLDKTVPRAFDEFMAAARNVRAVIEMQTFLGRVDVRLSLIARDLPDYQRIYRDEILTLPHIADIEALMTVAQVKHDESLPL
jgi:Lrp/AsnC family transcriptional regulator